MGGFAETCVDGVNIDPSTLCGGRSFFYREYGSFHCDVHQKQFDSGNHHVEHSITITAR